MEQTEINILYLFAWIFETQLFIGKWFWSRLPNQHRHIFLSFPPTSVVFSLCREVRQAR